MLFNFFVIVRLERFVSGRYLLSEIHHELAHDIKKLEINLFLLLNHLILKIEQQCILYIALRSHHIRHKNISYNPNITMYKVLRLFVQKISPFDNDNLNLLFI